mgnify:CR=1 FL=1
MNGWCPYVCCGICTRTRTRTTNPGQIWTLTSTHFHTPHPHPHIHTLTPASIHSHTHTHIHTSTHSPTLHPERCDGIVRGSIGARKFATKVQKHLNAPTWDETFEVIFRFLSHNQHLRHTQHPYPPLSLADPFQFVYLLFLIGSI